VAKPAASEPRMRAQGVHIIIEASGYKRQELIRAAVLMLQISGDKKPVIDVTSVSQQEEAAFLYCFPAARLVADLRWHQASASLVFPEGASSSPDFAIFALGSDIETLEVTERFWMRHETPDKQVIACLEGDDGTANLVSFKKKSRDFEVVNLIKQGLDPSSPLQHPFEREAAICHAVYFAGQRTKNPDYSDLPESWDGLDEPLKESNRLAAMQNFVAGIMWRTRGNTPGTEMLTHLARCEHMRWMAEKAMFGWRWSGSKENSTRDNNKLKHPLLCEYDALAEQEKEKDFSMFLWSLDLKDSELEELALDENITKLVLVVRKLFSLSKDAGWR
jgi:hypothetical protein